MYVYTVYVHAIVMFVYSIDTGGMWLRTPASQDLGPTLFKGSFSINDIPQDTFIDMKVCVYINNHIIMFIESKMFPNH